MFFNWNYEVSFLILYILPYNLKYLNENYIQFQLQMCGQKELCELTYIEYILFCDIIFEYQFIHR